MKTDASGHENRSPRSPWMRWLPAIAVLVSALWASAASSAGGGEPFTHGKDHPHVWKFWNAEPPGGGGISPEYWRDCRGCHDYSTGRSEPRDPQAVCRDCHYGPAGWSIVPPDENAHLPRSKSSFKRHQQHESLACGECHYFVKGTGRDHLTAETGFQSCERCHGSKAPKEFRTVFDLLDGKSRTIDRKKVELGIGEELNRDAALRVQSKTSFQHAHHLGADELSSKAKCNECHQDVQKSDAATLTTSQFDDESCGRCHQKEDKRPVKLGREPETRKSASALTFDHRDHFRGKTPKVGSCKPGALEEIEGQGCLACHENSTSLVPPSFAVKATRQGYDGCMTCHDKRFETTHHKKWSKCTDCHAIGPGEKMESNRVTTVVDRALSGATTFRMPRQRHPGLVGQRDDDCAKCHVATITDLPSRIETARFDHAPHLAAGTDSKACDACHAGVVNVAQSSVGIGRPWTSADAPVGDGSALVTFDVAACATCHPGIAIEPRSLEERAPRTVAEFPHKLHLDYGRDPTKPGQPLGCTSCHEVDAKRRGQSITTPTDVQNCSKCHGHDEPKAAVTGKIGKTEVQSCSLCHDGPMPKPGDTLSMTRNVITLQEPQFHPADAKCESCHSFGTGGLLPKIEVVGSSWTTKRDPHQGDDRNGVDCRDCHWAVERGSIPTDFKLNPISRAKVGHLKTFYPGGERWHRGAKAAGK